MKGIGLLWLSKKFTVYLQKMIDKAIKLEGKESKPKQRVFMQKCRIGLGRKKAKKWNLRKVDVNPVFSIMMVVAARARGCARLAARGMGPPQTLVSTKRVAAIRLRTCRGHFPRSPKRTTASTGPVIASLRLAEGGRAARNFVLSSRNFLPFSPFSSAAAAIVAIASVASLSRASAWAFDAWASRVARSSLSSLSVHSCDASNAFFGSSNCGVVARLHGAPGPRIRPPQRGSGSGLMFAASL